MSLQKSEDSKRTLSCMMESTLLLLPLRKNYSVFGLEALTASLAGIPILVSERSGVAALLYEVGEDGHSIVKQGKDFHSNVRSWAEQISDKISKQSNAKEEANKLRESLLQSTHIGTTHLGLLSTLIRRYLQYNETVCAKRSFNWSYEDCRLYSGTFRKCYCLQYLHSQPTCHTKV